MHLLPLFLHAVYLLFYPHHIPAFDKLRHQAEELPAGSSLLSFGSSIVISQTVQFVYSSFGSKKN
jgi:hypothetical protein